MVDDEGGQPRSRVRLVALGSAAMLGVLATGGLIMAHTNAAFTGTTDNAANAWQAGSVTIGDDDSGGAMFSATGLLPGDTGSKCIKVSYAGDVAATVKLYASASAGSLAPYVDLVVEEASLGTNNGTFGGGCAGFAGSTLYSGTINGFASASTGFGSGVGSFAPSASGQYRVYRFTWTLDAATPSAQQGQSATVTFQWEAQA